MESTQFPLPAAKVLLLLVLVLVAVVFSFPLFSRPSSRVSSTLSAHPAGNASPRKSLLSLPSLSPSLLRSRASTAHANGDLGAYAPKPPVWPAIFQLQFSEDDYFYFFTLTTQGTYYYDYAHGRERIERVNGLGDRYCGSAMAGYSTPCVHLVFGGMRYLIFEEQKYCCKCCTDAGGCGVVRPNWLENATFMGHDYIFGVLTEKWKVVGAQNNYYWHAYDNVPVRIYQEPVTQMTFNHSSFSTPPSFDDALFHLPSSLDCSPQCYGICSLLQ